MPRGSAVVVAVPQRVMSLDCNDRRSRSFLGTRVGCRARIATVRRNPVHGQADNVCDYIIRNQDSMYSTWPSATKQRPMNGPILRHSPSTDPIVAPNPSKIQVLLGSRVHLLQSYFNFEAQLTRHP